MQNTFSRFSGLLSFNQGILAAVTLAVFGLAWGTPVQAQDTSSTTTEAQQLPPVPAPAVDKKHKPIFLTFTKVGSSNSASPDATFGCNVGYPNVTTNWTTNQVQWNASISCSIALGLYGTTVLFDYPNGPNVAYGNQINTTAASAQSSGSSYAPNGNYEVNFNIIITPPAGYTTTVGGYCYYLSGNTQVECNVPSGEFQMQ